VPDKVMNAYGKGLNEVGPQCSVGRTLLSHSVRLQC
jgi:hypothetical protein